MTVASHDDRTAVCHNAMPAHLAVRLAEESDRGQTYLLDEGRFTVGSGPQCSVRLSAPGIRPLHCVIVSDEEGTSVRRWSSETLLNGERFDAARLSAGDRLSLGSVALDIVEAEPDAASSEEREARQSGVPQLAEQADNLLEALQQATAAVRDDSRADDHATDRPAPDRATTESIQLLRESRQIARSRSRQLLAALRRDRQQLAELQQRVGRFEEEVEQLVHERDMLNEQLAQAANAVRAEREAWDERLDQQEQERTAQIRQLESQLQEMPEPATEDADVADPPHDAEQDAAVPDDSDETPDEPPEPEAAAGESPTWGFGGGEIDQELLGHLPLARRPKPPEAKAHPAADADSLSDTDATAHLRELANWKQDDATEQPTGEPVDVASEPEQPIADTGESPVSPGMASDQDEVSSATDEVEQPAPAEDAAPGGSFIDRYAHLFEEDEQDGEPPGLSGGAAGERQNLSTAVPSRSTPPAEPAPPTGAEEDTIEAYMARLMERVQGRGSTGGSQPATFAPPTPQSTATETPAAPSAWKPSASEAAEGEAPDEKPPLTMENLRAGGPVPELAADLGALRDLANQSARQAIITHASYKNRKSVFGKLGVATIAIGSGLYLTLTAPGPNSAQFSIGGLALVLAVYWGTMTLRVLIGALREGSFEVAQRGDVNRREPQLPIDVEK